MHLVFDNGITLSIQIGHGNYCSNRNLSESADSNPMSHDAEIAIWNANDQWLKIGDNDDVRGWVSIDAALTLATILKALPEDITPDQFNGNDGIA